MAQLQPSFNPMLTTNAGGTFGIQSEGYIQGCAMADPSSRFRLFAGSLNPAETLPMWGGVAIYENIPLATGVNSTNRYVGRATGLTGAFAMTGISVFDQAHAMITTPTSPVPLATSNMTVSAYRFGSMARIPVQIDPSLASLDGSLITTPVSWDFGGQRLVPYVAAYAANAITAASWSGGLATLTTTSAHGIAVGNDFSISGMVPAGYNGSFTAVTGTTGSTLVYALATNPGTETVNGTLLAGGGALPCKILDIIPSGNMTVVYDPVYGNATWNRNGACALIQI